jgi:hypothetical protein
MKIALHKIGVGAVYQSTDKRASAVQKTYWTDATYGKPVPYYKWVARLDGQILGEGSLAQARKLINEAASKAACVPR